MKTTATLLCLTILALPLPLSAQSSPAWRVIGPGGGGAQFTPTISPHDPNHVLVSCDMTGSYITHDGGASWRMFNLRGRSRFFLFDPSDPRVLYAQSFGLFRSADAGRTWSLLHPDPATITGIVHPDDHAGTVPLLTGPREPLIALAVDPAASAHLYAAFTTTSGAVLRLSRDTGASWTNLKELPGGARQILIDPASPRSDRTVYVIGRDSVAVREAGAWRTGPSASRPFTSISAGFPQGGGKLHIWTLAEGIVRTEDGGASWTPANGNLDARGYNAIATSARAPHVAYVSYTGLRAGESRTFGVARTSDSGRTWTPVWQESTVKSPTVDDGWISARFGPGWGSAPLDLGVSPTNPDICYATDFGRTLRTTDGGKTWRAVYTRKTDRGAFQSTGLDVTTNYGIHWDPFDRRRVFISYTDIGLFRSDDGGASWVEPLPDGIPRGWRNTTYWVEFDPKVRGRMWAAMSGTHDLPRPKMWRTASPDNYRGGIMRSDDGGLTWTPQTNGMPQTAATHVLLDPASPVNARVLYAAGFGRGVYKSSDGGATWTLKNRGLPEKQPFAWRLTLSPDRSLYLVLARRSEDGSYGNEADGGLYRSTDGAETWQRIALPEGLNGPNGLSVDPGDAKRLYLSAWGRRTEAGAVMGGIWLSADAGRSWRNVHGRDQHVYDVTVDPRNPKILYACGFESSAWRSADRGLTWRRIRGYNFKWGHRVVPDPFDRGKIYVTTYGGSVWHGPARGDAGASEDIQAGPAALSFRESAPGN